MSKMFCEGQYQIVYQTSQALVLKTLIIHSNLLNLLLVCSWFALGAKISQGNLSNQTLF